MAAVHFTTIPWEFVPVLTTLCMPGLKFLELFCAFYERSWGYRTLTIMGKCTSRHVFWNSGLTLSEKLHSKTAR